MIDSGIRTTHTEFEGRARVVRDSVGDGRNGQDGNGHRSHVAATSGLSTASKEWVTYNGAAGYSIWKVLPYSWSGSYEGGFKHP